MIMPDHCPTWGQMKIHRSMPRWHSGKDLLTGQSCNSTFYFVGFSLISGGVDLPLPKEKRSKNSSHSLAGSSDEAGCRSRLLIRCRSLIANCTGVGTGTGTLFSDLAPTDDQRTRSFHPMQRRRPFWQDNL